MEKSLWDLNKKFKDEEYQFIDKLVKLLIKEYLIITKKS